VTIKTDQEKGRFGTYSVCESVKQVGCCECGRVSVVGSRMPVGAGVEFVGERVGARRRRYQAKKAKAGGGDQALAKRSGRGCVCKDRGIGSARECEREMQAGRQKTACEGRNGHGGGDKKKEREGREEGRGRRVRYGVLVFGPVVCGPSVAVGAPLSSSPPSSAVPPPSIRR
jgi:hypothetical protein